MEDLLTAVFIAHTKVLTAIRLGQHQKKVEINIPKVDHFLFKVLCETAKLLWCSSYLFRDCISSIEKQQNYRAIEGMLNEGILQAVRTLVPVKSILKDFVHSDGGAGSDSKEAKSGMKEAEGDEEESDEEDNHVTVAPAPAPAPALAPALAPTPAPALAPAPLLLSPSPTDPLPTLSPHSLELESLPSLPSLPSIPSLPPLPPALSESVPPTIMLEEKPTVRFGHFDSVFHLDHPNESDMVYDPKESDTDELDILDRDGTPLDDDDVDTLELEGPPLEMEKDDYEELV
mgnify:FL=1